MKYIGALFGLAIVALGAAVGVYLFWDGILDIINVLKAPETDSKVLAWGLVRVLGLAEFVGAIIVWPGVAITVACLTSRPKYHRGPSSRQVEVDWERRMRGEQ